MTHRPTHNPAGPGRRRGFTLIELMVVLAIVASLMGAAVYGISAITATNLRDQSMRMTSVFKHTWSQAALKHTNYRLVLDLDNNTYWTEMTDAGVIKRPDSDGSSEGKLAEQRRRDQNRSSTQASELFDQESDPFGIYRPTNFEKAKSAAINAKNFKDGVRIYEVLTTQQEEPITSGKAAVSFFPNGFQEPVIIVLQNENGAFYSLVNQPLTGRVNIYSKRIEDRDMLEHGEDDE